MAQRFGFFFLVAYLLAEVVNGAAHRFTGGSTYITWVCLAFLPLLLLVNGRLLASLHLTVGKMWVFLAVWMILDVATSVYKTGSLLLLWNYVPRSLMLYFFITSFVATVTDNRRLMNVNILATVLLMVNCAAFGSMKSGRLEVPDSLFFENANDLGLALLLGMCQAAYLFFLPGIKPKLWGLLVALGSLYYMLKTGSRGCFAALLLTGCVAFLLSRQKIAFGVAGLVSLAVVLLATPDEMRHRLTFIVTDPTTVQLTTEDEMGSYGSQMVRQRLFMQSLELTLRHPLFGVGPGDFPVAIYEDLKRVGKRANWLGTHNSYTEVSSECGLPALFAYLWIVGWTLKTSWKMYRRPVSGPAMNAVAGLSYSLFMGTLAYASATFFFHLAYAGFLPTLSGSVAALWSATRSGDALGTVAPAA
ncbi:MAG TPA: O-antigen ligase family protein [Bryobacteraceae bacterium]|nr:O-antigen ligase family protein [Bryobacteraceae bacterium]